MTNMKQASDMKTANQQKQSPSNKRAVALSPELSEVLHMLKSLETEFESPEAPQR